MNATIFPAAPSIPSSSEIGRPPFPAKNEANHGLVSLDLETVARYRRGRIVVDAQGKITVRRRWLPGLHSLAAVWWDSGWGRQEDETCVLDYHVPRGLSGFITLDYIRSGSKAGYRRFLTALRTLDAIARTRGSHAIVAHVTNPNITDRLLQRLGWAQHCLQWSGRHWIKRFE